MSRASLHHPLAAADVPQWDDEADVVILVGLTSKAAARPDWLYVGASRARAALYLLALEDTALAFDASSTS